MRLMSLVRLSIALVTCACDTSSGGSSSPTDSGTGSMGSGGAGQVDPCTLLSDAQVESVLPGHDAGMVAHAGPSLIDGVNAYQCSYANANVEVFSVVLNIAVDQAHFVKIEPDWSGLAGATIGQDVAVGDRGYLYGEADDLKLTATRGLTVIDLELLATKASDRSAPLVAAGQAVAAKVR